MLKDIIPGRKSGDSETASPATAALLPRPRCVSWMMGATAASLTATAVFLLEDFFFSSTNKGATAAHSTATAVDLLEKFSCLRIMSRPRHLSPRPRITFCTTLESSGWRDRGKLLPRPRFLHCAPPSLCGRLGFSLALCKSLCNPAKCRIFSKTQDYRIRPIITSKSYVKHANNHSITPPIYALSNSPILRLCSSSSKQHRSLRKYGKSKKSDSMIPSPPNSKQQ